MAFSFLKLGKRLLLLSAICFGAVMVTHLVSHSYLRHATRSTNLLQPHWNSNFSHVSIDAKPPNISTPKTNIVFLKVHKAASSTVQNIFLRFALSRRLNVLLPRFKNIYHINEHRIDLNENDLIALPPNSNFNILTHHLVFNKAEISRIFPDDTVYIGIVREPYSRFVSSLYYYATVWNMTGLGECVKDNDDPVQAFLLDPEKYDPERRVAWSQVNNRMSRDFGMIRKNIIKSKRNVTYIKQFIKRVDSEIDLVLVMEYFDYSMVMMKRFLNWSFKDIVYMKINQLNATIKQRTKSNFESNKALYKLYAPSEFALYDHFLSIYQDRVKSLGQDFMNEVKAFQKVRKVVENFCKEARVAIRPSLLEVDGTRWSEPFQLPSLECTLMQTDEFSMTDMVRNVQMKRLARYYSTDLRV